MEFCSVEVQDPVQAGPFTDLFLMKALTTAEFSLVKSQISSARHTVFVKFLNLIMFGPQLVLLHQVYYYTGLYIYLLLLWQFLSSFSQAFQPIKKNYQIQNLHILLQATTAAGFIHLIIRQCFFPRLKSCDFSSVTKSAKQFIEKYISIYEQQCGVPIAKKN